MPYDPSRVARLADLFLSGVISPEEFAELEGVLLGFPQARDAFSERLCIEEDIRFAMRAQSANRLLIDDLLSGPFECEASQLEQGMKRSARPLYWGAAYWGAALVSALAATVVAMVWSLGGAPPTNRFTLDQLVDRSTDRAADHIIPEKFEQAPAPRRTIDAIAVLYNQDHAVWSERPNDLSPGVTFVAGETLKLASGLVDLTFRSGAQLVLEGPAEVELVSDMEVLLIAGKLAAKVPDDAIGFAVRTEEARILDLGTEFGVVARPDGCSEVVVFDGEVIVAPRGRPGQNQRLLAGAALRANSSGLVRADNELNAGSFTRSVATQEAAQGELLVANFRRDFLSAELDKTTPAARWRYLWNANGPLGDPVHYQDLRWNGMWGYTTTGSGPFPAPKPAQSLCLRETGGHPGPDAKTSVVHTFGHGPVAAFTVPESGDYAIVDSWLSRLDDRRFDEVIRDNEFGIDVMVHVGDRSPAFSGTGYDTNTIMFDVDLPGLKAGDTIYVAVGPNHSSRYDTFVWNFSIARVNTTEQ